MFVACDEEYEALIHDEFTLQVASGGLQRHSVVDTVRAVQNNEMRFVGYGDLQRRQEQAMLYIRERRVPPPEYLLPCSH